MARLANPKTEDKKLNLRDILTIIYPDAKNNVKRAELFNEILHNNASECRLTPESGCKKTSYFINGTALEQIKANERNPVADIRKKLYLLFAKNPSLSKDLSNIFNNNINIKNPVMELKAVYEREKLLYPYYLIKHIDEFLSSDNYDYISFVKWVIFISCFSLNDNFEDTNFLLKISDIIEKKFRLNMEVNDIIDHFIKQKLEIDDELLQVNIAANNGLRWIEKNYRAPFLYDIVNKAKEVNILITEHITAERFSSLTRDSKYSYSSKSSNPVDRWKEHLNKNISENCKSKIHFKVSKVPALRQYIEFVFKDTGNSSIFVTFYTYGEEHFNKNHYLNLNYGDNYYNLYKDEFNFLFNLKFETHDSSDIISEEIVEKISDLDDDIKVAVLKILKNL